MGDPTGVGPEIIIQAVGQGAFAGLSRPVVVVGDLAIMQRAAQVCGCELVWQPDSPTPLASGELVFSGRTLPLRERSCLDPAQQKIWATQCLLRPRHGRLYLLGL